MRPDAHLVPATIFSLIKPEALPPIYRDDKRFIKTQCTKLKCSVEKPKAPTGLSEGLVAMVGWDHPEGLNGPRWGAVGAEVGHRLGAVEPVD